MSKLKTTILGIDSSSTNCGVSVYINGKFIEVKSLPFKGTFDFSKLNLIIKTFSELFDTYKPQMIVIEEALSARNGKVTRTLNQIFGAILAVCCLKNIDYISIHPSQVKSLVKIKHKEESLEKALELTGKNCNNNDESDSILLVEAYKRLINCK